MTGPLATIFLIAEAAATSGSESSIFTPLVNAGAMGVCLSWFMWQFSKKEDERNQILREQTKALNANTNAMMVVVIALKNGDSNVTELAQRIADDTKPKS